MPTRSIAIVADRIAWEERQLIQAGPELGLAVEWINDESLCLGSPDASALAGFDAVLLRSRSYTRGGLIATLAEEAGARVINSAHAINLCENKAVLRTALRTAGIPVPEFRMVFSRSDFTKALTEFTLPVVLKPVYGGMGKRVTLIRDSNLAHSVYDYVEDLGHAFEQACLVEPFLAGGASVRCLVVGTELVGVAEFSTGGEDWRNNAALGNTSHAASDDPYVAKIVSGVLDVLGPGIYGVDLFRTPKGYVVNEVNHAPGFRGVATATGVNVAMAIGNYLEEVLG